MSSSENNRQGFAFGLLGVLGFSFTLPATRMAVDTLDPITVGLGRALIAALLAAPLLLITRQKVPGFRQWGSIAVVMIGVIIGFPLLTAWAMKRVPASHGAVVLGLLPLATTIFGAIRAHERPSFIFWAASMVGSLTVVGYALSFGGGGFQLADLALLGAVVLAALGYAEGAWLARSIGGWQVICWALVLAAPLLIGPVYSAIARNGFDVTPTSLTGFAYVSLISMFLAFFAWYRGLALGGVARISQLQLLQPFLTLLFSAVFLNERFSIVALASAVVVALSIFVSKQSRVTIKDSRAST